MFHPGMIVIIIGLVFLALAAAAAAREVSQGKLEPKDAEANDPPNPLQDLTEFMKALANIKGSARYALIGLALILIGGYMTNNQDQQLAKPAATETKAQTK